MSDGARASRADSRLYFPGTESLPSHRLARFLRFLFRQLTLPWGVEPFLMEFSDTPEETILNALAYLKRRDWCGPGTWLVVITNALANERVIDTLQLRQVESIRAAPAGATRRRTSGDCPRRQS